MARSPITPSADFAPASWCSSRELFTSGVLFTPHERNALLWTEVLTRLSDGPVRKEDFEAVRKEFSEEEMTNLTLAIVTINRWHRFTVGFACHLAPT